MLFFQRSEDSRQRSCAYALVILLRSDRSRVTRRSRPTIIPWLRIAPRITYGPILGRDVQPTSDVRAMLAQVREPLLSVLQISPEFRPTYDPLLRMATAIGTIDVAATRALLTELQQAQPSRPEAAQVLRELPDASR